MASTMPPLVAGKSNLHVINVCRDSSTTTLLKSNEMSRFNSAMDVTNIVYAVAYNSSTTHVPIMNVTAECSKANVSRCIRRKFSLIVQCETAFSVIN